MSTALAPNETRRFQTLKRQISEWWNDRLRIGEALREIRDSQLYRQDYETFEAFCIAEFDIKHSQAYRLIEAAAVKESVKTSPIGDKLTNEGQARALAVVPPERRVEVLEKAAQSGTVTAKKITEAANGNGHQAKEQHLDKTGFPIPDSILEDWQRATETARQLLSQISNIRSEVKHGLDDQDVIYAEINNTTLADLTNAYTSIKCVVPYSVCTSCQGFHKTKCGLCKGRGFLSEFAYRSYVPLEIKAIREKLKK